MTRPGYGPIPPNGMPPNGMPPNGPAPNGPTPATTPRRGWFAGKERQLLGIAVAAAVVVAIIATVLAVVGIPVARSARIAAGPVGPAGAPLTIGLPTQPVQRWTATATDVFGPSAHDVGYTSSGGGIAVLGALTDTDNMVMAVGVTDGRPRWQHPAVVPDAKGCWVTDFGDVLCRAMRLGKRPATLYFISGTDGTIRKQIDMPASTMAIADVNSTWIVYTSMLDTDATDTYGFGPDGEQRWKISGDLNHEPLVSQSTGLVAIQSSTQGQVVRGTDGRVVYTNGGRDASFNRITLFYNGFAVSAFPRGSGKNQVTLFDADGKQIAVNLDGWQTADQGMFDLFSASVDCQGILVHRTDFGASGEEIGVLDQVTGKLLWQSRLGGDLRNDRCNGDRVFSIPFTNGYSDTVFDLRTGKQYGTVDLVSSSALMGTDGERAIYRISASPGSSATVAITAFDLTTMQKVWTQPIDDSVEWNLDSAGFWKIGSGTVSRFTSG